MTYLKQELLTENKCVTCMYIVISRENNLLFYIKSVRSVALLL